MVNDVLEIKYLTPPEEKIKRLEELLPKFMGKYFELVWFARSDEKNLLEKEQYETLTKLKEIAEKYKKEVEGLYSESSDWHHGFNSGVLAFVRYVSDYIEDTWWPEEDTGGVEFDEKDITVIDGHRFVKMDGKEQAESGWPMLDT